MAVYYNEVDPLCVAWLRNLIKAGRLPEGDVDERPIQEVHPLDIDGYDACHWFAGLGGWPLAGRLAGLPDGFGWWSGSAPCQPFSSAGEQKGFSDERHLWPSFFNLVRECKPAIILGEQVPAAIRHGWIDLVASDLARENYTLRFAVLGAHSVGSPHLRQRIYWVGDAEGGGRLRVGQYGEAAGGMGEPVPASVWDNCEWLPCRDGFLRPVEPGSFPLATGISQRVGQLRAYGNAICVPLAAEFIKAALHQGSQFKEQ